MNNSKKNKKRKQYTRVRLTAEEMEAYQSFDGSKKLKVNSLFAPKNPDDYPEIGTLNDEEVEEVTVCTVSFFKAKNKGKGRRDYVAMGSEVDIKVLKKVLSEYRTGKRKIRKRNPKNNDAPIIPVRPLVPQDKTDEETVKDRKGVAGQKGVEKTMKDISAKGQKEKQEQGPKKEKGEAARNIFRTMSVTFPPEN